MVYPMRRPRASTLPGVSPCTRLTASHQAAESLDLTAARRAKIRATLVSVSHPAA
jgi:hypothetical protein